MQGTCFNHEGFVFCEYHPKRFPIIFFLSAVNILAYNYHTFISLLKLNKVIIAVKCKQCDTEKVD